MKEAKTHRITPERFLDLPRREDIEKLLPLLGEKRQRISFPKDTRFILLVKGGATKGFRTADDLLEWIETARLDRYRTGDSGPRSYMILNAGGCLCEREYDSATWKWKIRSTRVRLPNLRLVWDD